MLLQCRGQWRGQQNRQQLEKVEYTESDIARVFIYQQSRPNPIHLNLDGEKNTSMHLNYRYSNTPSMTEGIWEISLSDCTWIKMTVSRTMARLSGISHLCCIQRDGCMWTGRGGGGKMGHTWLPAALPGLTRVSNCAPAPPAAAAGEHAAPAGPPPWCRWPPPLLSGGPPGSDATPPSHPKKHNRPDEQRSV